MMLYLLRMKSLTIGLLAHVDAGKTSLSEAILYESGSILKSGRVDSKNAFLDFENEERNRGITIFSKQAIFKYGETNFTMIDTPGHVDFSCEMERVLKVLDVAILVINGQAGVEPHTDFIFKLLNKYHIPTFIFVNKMDIAYDTKDGLLAKIAKDLKANVIDFSHDDVFEDCAMCDDSLLDKYLNGLMDADDIKDMITQNKIIPCLFGSATKNIGIDRLLEVLDKYNKEVIYDNEFKARVFKVNYINNTRLVHAKILGGSIRVKSLINDEKIDEIRYYNGPKYITKDLAVAGDICAFKGLKNVLVGDCIGFIDDHKLNVEPYLTYAIEILDNTDIRILKEKLNELENEDPTLNVKIINDKLHISLMGEIQTEILKKIIKERFNIDIEFKEALITYKETIKNPVIGVGHFEPLKHYAEVHLLLEPLKSNSGVVIENECLDENLPMNYQRLIISLLSEKTHLGILTNSPLCDIKISLLNAKAHLKHTEGGDFKEATYRAIRQGLSEAENVLLEPYCDFVLIVKEEYMSKAIYDIDLRNATYNYHIEDEIVTFNGVGTIASFMNYQREVIAYTKGSGRFNFSFKEYNLCLNASEVIEKINYDYKTDLKEPAGSIFCEHGAGTYVPSDKVKERAHIKLDYIKDKSSHSNYNRLKISDDELKNVLSIRNQKEDKTYIKKDHKNETYKSKDDGLKPKCYIIDGYNVLYGHDYFKDLAKTSLAIARDSLIDMVCNYRPLKSCRMILVFDAYDRENINVTSKKYDGIDVIYTKYGQTADMYIEKHIKELVKDYRMYVVSSDGLIQNAIFSSGAFRVSVNTFMNDVTNLMKYSSKDITKDEKKLYRPLENLKDIIDEENDG